VGCAEVIIRRDPDRSGGTGHPVLKGLRAAPAAKLPLAPGRGRERATRRALQGVACPGILALSRHRNDARDVRRRGIHRGSPRMRHHASPHEADVKLRDDVAPHAAKRSTSPHWTRVRRRPNLVRKHTWGRSRMKQAVSPEELTDAEVESYAQAVDIFARHPRRPVFLTRPRCGMSAAGCARSGSTGTPRANNRWQSSASRRTVLCCP
jgi:hypothetical protein